MANYHGVEWYHDKLSLMVAAGGHMPRLYTGLNYSAGRRHTNVRDGLPARATHAVWAHWKCAFGGVSGTGVADPRELQWWFDDGIALQPPNLKFASDHPDRCCLCGGWWA